MLKLRFASQSANPSKVARLVDDDLKEQELTLGVVEKIMSPSKLLHVDVDVDKGVDLPRFLSLHETTILNLQVLVFYFFVQVGLPLFGQLLESGV